MRKLLSRLTAATLLALPLALAAAPIRAGAPPLADAELGIVRLVSGVPTALADSDDDVSIDEIGKVKRGKENVKLRADVGKSGLICKFKLKYADGNADSLDDVESNKKGICETAFDVPDRKTAVGDAIVKLKVETKKGDDKGKATRWFTVSDRRGG